MASQYPWYTKVVDAGHRLTVLTLIGTTLYVSGGLCYTLYMNGQRNQTKFDPSMIPPIQGEEKKEEQ